MDYFTISVGVLSVTLAVIQVCEVFARSKSKRIRSDLVDAAREAQRWTNEVMRCRWTPGGYPTPKSVRERAQQEHTKANKKLKVARDKDWAYNGYPTNRLEEILKNEGLWLFAESA